MASGLKRDPLVILRMDGEDILEFINSPSYEAEMSEIFSKINNTASSSVIDCISKALQHLTVDHGMPPLSDSWVMSNIVEPSLKYGHDGPITEEKLLLQEFKKVALSLAQLLKDQPVIVAHTDQTFHGTDIRRLLSSKFELNKLLEGSIEDLAKDDNGKLCNQQSLGVVLDMVRPSAGLPPLGLVKEMDDIMKEAVEIKIVEMGHARMMDKEELKKVITEILEKITLQLEENPVSVSSSSVVHEPLSSTLGASSSTP